jgi:three-Cys-motif partner protein
MTKVDIYKEAFDEGTKAKLKLLRLYIREWLPVFLVDSNISYSQIEIYDFFAGEGQDNFETPGSPLIILEELSDYCSSLALKKTRLTLLFNDFDKLKYQKLIISKDNFLRKCSQDKRCGLCNNDGDLPNCPFEIKIVNSDFTLLFNALYATFRSNPNIPRFMFIDQYGIKQVTKKIF